MPQYLTTIRQHRVVTSRGASKQRLALIKKSPAAPATPSIICDGNWPRRQPIPFIVAPTVPARRRRNAAIHSRTEAIGTWRLINIPMTATLRSSSARKLRAGSLRQTHLAAPERSFASSLCVRAYKKREDKHEHAGSVGVENQAASICEPWLRYCKAGISRNGGNTHCQPRCLRRAAAQLAGIHPTSPPTTAAPAEQATPSTTGVPINGNAARRLD